MRWCSSTACQHACLVHHASTQPAATHTPLTHPTHAPPLLPTHPQKVMDRRQIRNGHARRPRLPPRRQRRRRGPVARPHAGRRRRRVARAKRDRGRARVLHVVLQQFLPVHGGAAAVRGADSGAVGEGRVRGGGCDESRAGSLLGLGLLPWGIDLVQPCSLRSAAHTGLWGRYVVGDESVPELSGVKLAKYRRGRAGSNIRQSSSGAAACRRPRVCRNHVRMPLPAACRTSHVSSTRLIDRCCSIATGRAQIRQQSPHSGCAASPLGYRARESQPSCL
jgi:hypothetical protein